MRWAVLVTLLGLPWWAIDGQAAVGIFLNLTRDGIKGETPNDFHKDEIDVLSMSFGASNTPSIYGSGKASVNDITLVKYTDRATPELMRRLLTGRHLNEARIEFVEAIDGKEYPVVDYLLEDVLVTGHTTGGNSGQDRLTESVSLNFREFSYQTFSVSEKGVVVDGPSVTWDLATNTGGGTGGGGSGGGGGTTNTVPTITSIPAQTLDEDGSVTVAFTVGDSQTPAGSLQLSRSTTNPLVVPIAGITFGGSGSSRNVTITPAADASGSSTVTITVTDGGGLTAFRQFAVTVNPVNDAPTIAPIGTQITTQDTPLDVTVDVGDIDTEATSVTVTPVSANPALIPSGNIAFSGSGATTRMTLTPLPGAAGSSLITVTANDGAASSVPVSFTLTVNPVGGTGPTDILLLDASEAPPFIAENSPPDTEVGFLTAADPDNAELVTFALIDSAGGRFKLGGAGLDHILVDNRALLDFESAASHQIIVRATDPESNTFDKALTINLINVNEAPVILAPAVVYINQGGSGPVAGCSLTDPDAGGADVHVTFSIGTGALHLDDSGALAGKVSGNDSGTVTVTAPVAAIQAVLAADGLVYSAADVAAGSYPLTCSADDLGNTGTGGPNILEVSISIEVRVTPFNQWREQVFNGVELADLAVSGALADADHDGVVNLLEYGVGSDPNDPADGPGRVEFIREDVAGVSYPALRFNRLRTELDPSLLISVELATDDFNWRVEPGDTVEVSATPADETHDQVVIRSTLRISDLRRQMMRLRFTLQDP